MKMYGGVDIYIHVFLILALVGERSASRFGCFTLGEEHQYTVNKRVGGAKPGLDDMDRRKICPYSDFNSDPLAVQLVTSRHIDYTILAPQ
jgi:hypothetical protein